MPKRIDSIDGCLDYLTKIKPNLRTEDMKTKLNSVLLFLWKPLEGHEKFTVWPYKRRDDLGFCLLLNNETLSKKPKKPFFFIKMKGATDYFNGRTADRKIILEPLRLITEFLNSSTEEFAAKFIEAAKKRAAYKKPA